MDDAAHDPSLSERVRLLEQAVSANRALVDTMRRHMDESAWLMAQNQQRIRANQIINQAADGTGPMPAVVPLPPPRPAPHRKPRRPNPMGLHVVRSLAPAALVGFVVAHARKIALAASGAVLAGGVALTPAITSSGPTQAGVRHDGPAWRARDDRAVPMAPLRVPPRGGTLRNTGGPQTHPSPRVSPAAAGGTPAPVPAPVPSTSPSPVVTPLPLVSPTPDPTGTDDSEPDIGGNGNGNGQKKHCLLYLLCA